MNRFYHYWKQSKIQSKSFIWNFLFLKKVIFRKSVWLNMSHNACNTSLFTRTKIMFFVQI
jgi:hypothetical protein